MESTELRMQADDTVPLPFEESKSLFTYFDNFCFHVFIYCSLIKGFKFGLSQES